MESRQAGSPFKLHNPFVLRVGQVMTGFGLGCGLGIGVGVPIPMDIPGIAQVMGAANGMTRHIGGGHSQLQGLVLVALLSFFGGGLRWDMLVRLALIRGALVRKRRLKTVVVLVARRGIAVEPPVAEMSLGSAAIPERVTPLLHKSSRCSMRVCQIKRVGIKNLEAGIGCGVGVGHGFGIGLALKPGASQQILHMLQEGCVTVLNKVRPQAHNEPHNETPGVPDAQASALKPSQSPFTNPLSQFASTPSIKYPETEVEKLRTQNEILRTLLRHQERIDDLEHENALLREQLNMNGITRSPSSGALNSRQTSTECFDCRRLARRRN